MQYTFVLVLLISLPCWTQTTTTSQASTNQPCSVANTGSDNKIQINCGIGKEQGQKILAVMNKILANQIDPNAVMAKLDEILQAVNPNLPKKTYTCKGGWTMEGPSATAMHEMKVDWGPDPAGEQMVKLSNAHQYKELLQLCTSQIKSKPEWLTPRLFCALAYGAMADTSKAKEMLDVYDAGKGPAYDGDVDCKKMSDFLHANLN